MGALRCSRNIYIIKDNIGRVRDKVIILRGVSKHQIAENRIVKTINANQNRPEGIDVFGIQVVPYLSIPIDGPTSINVNIITPKFEE